MAIKKSPLSTRTSAYDLNAAALNVRLGIRVSDRQNGLSRPTAYDVTRRPGLTSVSGGEKPRR
jgi:hypothetical protein